MAAMTCSTGLFVSLACIAISCLLLDVDTSGRKPRASGARFATAKMEIQMGVLREGDLWARSPPFGQSAGVGAFAPRRPRPRLSAFARAAVSSNFHLENLARPAPPGYGGAGPRASISTATPM